MRLQHLAIYWRIGEMAVSQHRTLVLRAYRELLGLIHRLPEAQRGSALAEARQSMRQHAAEADEGQQQDLLKQLAAKISFLRTITPRKPGEISAMGSSHYVMRDGKLVEGVGRTAGTRWAAAPEWAPGRQSF